MALGAAPLTFLFTDIENSTQLWEQHPQAMGAALVRHDAILREAITAHQGEIFKTGGDSFYAAFAEAPAALRTAIRAQRTLSTEPWVGLPPVRVRMALHTGTVEHRGGDYFGPAANRTARLLAAGHGGQTLLSARAAEALQTNRTSEWQLRDLGEHRLKDLARPEHIYQLEVVGLPAHFPPLRSLEAFAHNLPVPVTSFIGRERDVVEVKQLLLGKARLVTLLGMGGTGKTRLSLQVAAEIFSAFSDGVWFVELAPLTEAPQVAQALAAALGLREEPNRPTLEIVLAYVRAKQLLLILDNCEHLVEACAQLAEAMLRQTTGVRLLTSSREGFNVPGEVLYRLATLAVPTLPTATPAVATLAQYEAVQLFVARAQAVRPEFALTVANAQAVAQICARLDGLPLALELAAARLKALTVEQIATRLDDRFRLLTGGSRTALPRQQTLQALVDWSYELLPETERTLFRALAVCAGGWTLEAAEALASQPTDGDTLDQLASLVNKSLVQVEEHAGETRYRYLETLRQYALARLTAAGELAAAQARHGAFFQAQVATAAPALRGPDQLRWLAYFDVERDNLRAALEWALTHEPATALAMSGTLWQWWYLRGLYQEGETWLTRALAAAPTPSRVRLEVLCGLAWLTNDFARRKALGTEAVAQGRALGETWLTAWALRGLGEACFDSGESATGRALVEESWHLFRQLGEPWGEAFAAYNMGWVFCETGDYVQAQMVWEVSLQQFRQTGDRWGIGSTLMALGNAARVLGDYDRAVAMTGECLSYFQDLQHKNGEAGAMSFLGLVALRRGEYATAITMWEECLATQQALGDVRGEANSLGYLGWAHIFVGHYDQAHRALTTSLQLAPDPRPVLHYNSLGQLEFFQGHLVAARQILTENLVYIRQQQAQQSFTVPLTYLALMAGLAGDFAQAQTLATESLQISQRIGEKRNIAMSLHTLGQLALWQNQLPAAFDYLRESLNLRVTLQARRGMAVCFETLAQCQAAQAAWPAAAQLAGAAEALRRRIGVPIHPVEQPDHEALLQNGQAALGAESWAEQFNAGRRLSQAAVLALVA